MLLIYNMVNITLILQLGDYAYPTILKQYHDYIGFGGNYT